MDKKSVDGITIKDFQHYKELFKERETSERAYKSYRAQITSLFINSRALVRVHWSLGILCGLGSAYMVYKSMITKQKYEKLDKELSELEEQALEESSQNDYKEGLLKNATEDTDNET